MKCLLACPVSSARLTACTSHAKSSPYSRFARASRANSAFRTSIRDTITSWAEARRRCVSQRDSSGRDTPSREHTVERWASSDYKNLLITLFGLAKFKEKINPITGIAFPDNSFMILRKFSLSRSTAGHRVPQVRVKFFNCPKSSFGQIGQWIWADRRSSPIHHNFTISQICKYSSTF